MSEVSIYIPDDGWFTPECNIKPANKQLCIIIPKYENQTPSIYQFRKSDLLYDKSDYFLNITEKWELDNTECSAEWYPSLLTFDLINCWKPLGLLASDNERLLSEIEKWFEN